MKRVSVTELKNQLSKYLRLVKRGETIVVIEHSVPIAQMTALERGTLTGDPLLQRQVDAGILAAPQAKPPARLDAPVPCSGDALAAMREDRDGR
jgi:antitoxin (DNA-binding transcriptional repressor) of toxin-antitoxin stability system